MEDGPVAFLSITVITTDPIYKVNGLVACIGVIVTANSSEIETDPHKQDQIKVLYDTHRDKMPSQDTHDFHRLLPVINR